MPLQNLINGPALIAKSRYENAATFDVAFRYCSSDPKTSFRQIGTSMPSPTRHSVVWAVVNGAMKGSGAS